MTKMDSSETLSSSISLLEQKRATDFMALKQQLRLTGESLKPANIIRGAVKDISGSSHFKSVLLKAALGLALGFVAKKVVTSQRHNIQNRLIGNALQYGISFLAANQNSFLKSASTYAANHLLEAFHRRRLKRRHLHNGVRHED